MGLSLCVECYLVLVRGKNAKCEARSAVNGLSGSKTSWLKGAVFPVVFLVKSVSRTKKNMVNRDSCGLSLREGFKVHCLV